MNISKTFVSAGPDLGKLGRVLADLRRVSRLQERARQPHERVLRLGRGTIGSGQRGGCGGGGSGQRSGNPRQGARGQGLIHVGRLVIKCVVSPRFLSYMISFDVASTMHRSLPPPAAGGGGAISACSAWVQASACSVGDNAPIARA